MTLRQILSALHDTSFHIIVDSNGRPTWAFEASRHGVRVGPVLAAINFQDLIAVDRIASRARAAAHAPN